MSTSRHFTTIQCLSGMRILDRSSFVHTLYLIISLSVTSVQLNESISSVVLQTEAGGHTIVLPIHIVKHKGME